MAIQGDPIGSKQSGPPPGMPHPDDGGALNIPMLISPPGQQAPVGLDNYTPSSRTLHPRGAMAPIDDMQVTGLGPNEMKALRAALMQSGKLRKRPVKANRPPLAPSVAPREMPPLLQDVAPSNDGGAAVLRPPSSY